MPTHFKKTAHHDGLHILFVYPPDFRMPIGTAYLISYLNQEGFTAGQFYADGPMTAARCVREITAKKPMVVGFTVYHANYCLCQLIARGIKEVSPGIIVLFGGPTATVQSRVVLENNPFVDICVRNEGEETCLELLSLLDRVHFDLQKAVPQLEGVKGISYRLGEAIVENPSRDVFFHHRHTVDYLDKYPSPYLSGIVKSFDLGIITARGCNRHCIYCYCSVLSKRVIATHSVDRVLEELDYLAGRIEPGRVVDIFDDAFGSLPERVMAICNKIIENKIKLPLICATRCDLIDEDFLDTLKAAGFKAVSFSLESAVPRILRILGKVQPPNSKTDDNFEKEKDFIEKFKKYAAYAKKIGIEIVYSSIMLGLPTETLEEGRKSVELIRSLGKQLDLHAHNLFEVYPGTPVYFNCESYGIKLLKYDNQVHYGVIHPYDTSLIDPAPNSSAERSSIARDKTNMKTMALSLSFRPETRFKTIDKIILCADRITGELILWLQKYLAMNGQFIQVYSNLEKAKQYYRENDHALYKYISPTVNYTGYYQIYSTVIHGAEPHPETVKLNKSICGVQGRFFQKEPLATGIIRLMPCRMFSLGKKCGLPIYWVNTGVGLTSCPSTPDPLQVICIDRDREDVLQLHRLLQELAKTDDLGEIPLYPYMSGLCRWENADKRPVNCRWLEMVIVDSHNQVRTCWNGEPVGKIGTPLPEIVENLENLHRKAEKKRGCKNCVKEAVCGKCIFPTPLSEAEYCDLRRTGDTGKGAESLRWQELFKGKFP
jgi:radical SAM superfamily enzyme YgiQ (UPF0313 family)